MNVGLLRVLAVFLLSLPMAGVPEEGSQVEIPDSPVGRRAAAYVSVFNKGDEKAMGVFWTANFTAESLRQRPVEERLQFYRRMREDMKRIIVVAVEESKPTSLVLRMKAENGGFFRFGFQVEPDPPHLLTGMRIESVEAPAQAPKSAAEPPKGSDAEAGMATDAFLRDLASGDEFSGVVLLARNNAAFLEKAYGLADREFRVPVNIETKFNLGSINKIFTKTAIAQLAAAGKFSLTDTIRKHLPRYGVPYAGRVTIQQLLDFSSGMGDIFGAKFEATPKDRVRTLADYLPFFESDPLKFEPGTRRLRAPRPRKLRRRRILDSPRSHEIRRRAQGRQARPSRVRLLDPESRRGRSEDRAAVGARLGLARHRWRQSWRQRRARDRR